MRPLRTEKKYVRNVQQKSVGGREKYFTELGFILTRRNSSLCGWQEPKKRRRKKRIRETLNLTTNADRSNNIYIFFRGLFSQKTLRQLISAIDIF